MVLDQTDDRSRYTLTYRCKTAGYTTQLQRKIYFTFQTLMFFVIPAGIMTYCYASITCVIWRRAGAQRAGVIDRQRIHFVSSRRPQSGSGSAVSIQLSRSVSPHPPEGGPTAPHSRVSMPRRMIFTTKLSSPVQPGGQLRGKNVSEK